MCCENECDDVVLLRGIPGNGIDLVADNGDGTFTFLFTDGTTFTTSDLTGPTGATGPTGPVGATGPAGTLPGSGTNNYVTKWTPDGTSIGDSLIQDDGSTLSIDTPLSSTHKFIIVGTTNDNVITGLNTKAGTGNQYGINGKSYGAGTGGNNVGVYGFAQTNTVKNIGVRGVASGATALNIGGHFIADLATDNYALQLEDSTEAVGRVLTCMTTDGKANWAALPASGGKTWYTVTGVNPTATLAPNSGYVIRDTSGGGTTDLTLPASGVSVGDEIKIIATMEGGAGALQNWQILEGNGADVIFTDIWDTLAANTASEVKSISPLWTFNNTPSGNWSNQKACTILLTCVQDLSPGYAWSIEFPNNART